MTSCLFPHIYVLGVNAKLRKASISFVKPASPFGRPSSWNNSAPAEEICIKFYVRWTITVVCGKHASLVKIRLKQYALYMQTTDIYDHFGYSRIHLDRLQNKYTNYKGITNNTNSGQITGIQEKLDITRK